MSKNHYPDVDANPDFVKLEEDILAFWKRENIFQQSVDKNKGTGEAYVFYDGPPFANGLPHYGHLLTGYVKDLVARYQTMRGKVVERRFGWDCHGLPAEMGAEKELGISGRQAIIEYGIGKFNDYCRENVMRYASEWERYVDRQGRWVDFKNDYKTMDKDFMESVLWAFSELYKKGLIYESYRVMPYSWAAETPLSNFETRLDNATREREDKAITVAFELDSPPVGAPEADKYYLLAWTTTPWTLPSNLALAVHPEMEYVCVVAPSLRGAEGDAAIQSKDSGLLPLRFALGRNDEKVCYITSLTWFQKHLKEQGVFEVKVSKIENDISFRKEIEIVSKGREPGDAEDVLTNIFENPIRGSALLNLTYKPLFPYFAHLKHVPHPNPLPGGEREATAKTGAGEGGAFRILDGSSFIEEGSGTGVVHLAPGFGEDDQKTCEANGIAIVCPVDDKGRYTDEIFDIPFVIATQSEAKGKQSSLDRHVADAPRDDEVLSLKGLNVIAENRLEESDKTHHISEKNVKDFGLANMRIVRWLKANGRLIKDEPFKHNYPHCWRTDTPIIYRALPSWYVQVTAFKGRAVELNKNIHWIPEHTRDGAMGHMLASAPDWSISRNRFWGCPIPVWKSPSGKIKVFGSIAELEEASGQKITDLHRPFIDEIVITEDGEEYHRVEEVLDCWFESGSMPFGSQWSEIRNRKKVDANFRLQASDFRFPADFITEYIGQTRGWFNTLIMLATALFDEQPFGNCICHGVVIDEETGLKYSKRLKNYKDPMEVFDTFGADALRWLMVSSGVMRGHDLGVDPEGKFIRDVVRLNIKPIWNAYNFFTLYANADGVKAGFSTESDNVMDQYILAKCRETVEKIKINLDAYDTPSTCLAVTEFFDILNNWYIRRNKDRFWREMGKPHWDTDGARRMIPENDIDQMTSSRIEMQNKDKQAAYNTLYTVLHTLCRAAAPLLPFTLEAVFRGLCMGQEKPSPLEGEGWVRGKDTPPTETANAVSTPPQGGSDSLSVHLQDFPNDLVAYETNESDLLQQMDWVRDVCNAAHAIRNKMKIRVRQPLERLTIIGKWCFESGRGLPKGLRDLIKDEINVKNIFYFPDIETYAELKLAVNFPVLGKRVPEKMKQIIPASKKGEWKKLDDGRLEIAGVVLESEEFSLKLEPKPEFKDNAQPLSTNDALVVLDLTLTPELIAEGMARDVVRMVQESRKKADLHISDKISLVITAPEKVAAAVEADGNKRYIAEQVLAESVTVGAGSGEFSFEHELEGEKVVISFSKVA